MVKRNRENFITIHLNNQELQELNEKVALTNMSREEYLRMIIKGCQPVAKPDIEYKEVLKQLRFKFHCSIPV